jgi:hypothetical protein
MDGAVPPADAGSIPNSCMRTAGSRPGLKQIALLCSSPHSRHLAGEHGCVIGVTERGGIPCCSTQPSHGASDWVSAPSRQMRCAQ